MSKNKYTPGWKEDMLFQLAKKAICERWRDDGKPPGVSEEDMWKAVMDYVYFD